MYLKQISAVLIAFLIVPVNATQLTGNPEELRNFLHPRKNIVSLYASAKLTAYADKAIVHLTITTDKKALAEALEANNQLRKEIKANLIKIGVKAENIHTSQFSSSPQFGWFGSKPKSYQVVNRMSISIFDEDHLTAIARLSDASKAIEISSTQFKHSKKKVFIQRVKQKAMAKIIQQKSFYEDKLGIKLKTQRFSESRLRFTGSQGAKDRENKIVILGSRLKRQTTTTSSSTDVSVAEPQSFDEIEYEISLTVDFSLENQ